MTPLRRATLMMALLFLAGLLVLWWSSGSGGPPHEGLDPDGGSSSTTDPASSELRLVEEDAMLGATAQEVRTTVDSSVAIGDVASATPRRGDLVVQVLDVRGEPVPDVWLTVRVRRDGELWTYNEFEKLSGRTEASGRAIFSERDLLELAKANGTTAAFVDLVYCGLDPWGESFQLDAPPAEPVQIQVPLGWAVVDVQDPDGTSRKDRGGLHVSIPDRGYDTRGCVPPYSIPVPLGHSFRLKTYGFGVMREVECSLPPLTEAEPIRHLVLRLEGREPAFVGRLLGPDGEPVPDQTRFELFNLEEGPYGSTSGWTQAGGRFQVELARRQLTKGEEARFRMESSLGRHVRDHYLEFRSTVPVDDVDVELGDLVFEARPLLVAGRIELPGTYCPGSFEVSVQSRPPGGDWRTLDHARSTAFRAPWEFVLYHAADPALEWRLVLKAWDRNSLDEVLIGGEPVRFLPGDDDVVLHALLAATVIGRLQHQESRPPSVGLRPEGADPDDPPLYRTAAGDDGRFRLAPLAPGRYSLVVREGSNSPPLRVLDSVVVQAGESLDLGTLQVEDGRPSLPIQVLGLEPGTRLMVRYRNSPSPLEAEAGRPNLPYEFLSKGENPVLVPVDRFPVDLVLEAWGRQTEVRLEVTGPIQVEFEPAPVVTVEYSGLEKYLDWKALRDPWLQSWVMQPHEYPYNLRLTWVRVDTTTETSRVRARYQEPVRYVFRVDPNVPVEQRTISQQGPVQFPSPGRYRLRIALDPIGLGDTVDFLQGEDPIEIQVEGTPGEVHRVVVPGPLGH